MNPLDTLVSRLCKASRNSASDPCAQFAWPERADPDAWHFSPELISICGTTAWEALDEPARKRLSLFEAVNFFSLNIHGERPLVEGLARRVYQRRALPETPYLHHVLDEENKHMVMFGTFCLNYAGKVYPDRRVAFARDFEPFEEDFLFYAQTFLFEEIVDRYNVIMSTDERLADIVRAINGQHHRDEARHLVFGRAQVVRLFEEGIAHWSGGTLERIRRYLVDYVHATWRAYFNPGMYVDAGLDEPLALAREAPDHPAARQRLADCAARAFDFLVGSGILPAGSRP